MRFVVVIFFLLFSSHALAVQPIDFSVIEENSSIAFTAKQNGSDVKGGFKSFEADIKFHPENLEESSANVKVNISSVITEDSSIVSTLKGFEWFDVESHPYAIFSVHQFRKIDGVLYEALGDLTIKSISIPVKLLFKLDEFSHSNASISGDLTIDRNAFGIGSRDDASVASDVIVNVKVTAVAK